MSAIPATRSIRGSQDSSRFVTWFRDYWISVTAAAVLSWIVIVPLVYLIVFSFRSGTAAAPGDWTLANYVFVYSSKMTHEAFGNTLVYTTLVATLSMAIAGGLAWFVERTDMPYRGAAWVMILLPIAMPGMLSSMAWILLLGPRTGLLNVMLREVFAPFGYDSPTGPINIYSLGGMIFVESVRGSTTLFLMLVAGFRLMDPALEEAASMSGARNSYTLRKITLPLMLPMLLATWMYSFIGTLDDFETPLLIGLPAQIFLLPTVIYFTAYLSSAWGLAAAYATIFLLISVVMVVIYHRVVLRRSSQFATVSGKAFRPRQIELGGMRWPALARDFLFLPGGAAAADDPASGFPAAVLPGSFAGNVQRTDHRQL
jgi:ABC-type Fe3+ transport system, permease component